ncbi:hypothetical protein AVMA1855_15860 [Acidovorax sp. SUPP1855]|uniref:hypothetical protein n=1 Tax=Acidovorax sp. SUPP1855 TaxID=431774 RepID=UPI0023DE677A|nr:hypothetical protein [Acidovorax sp. SUPP1855]GKS85646.1 hypothetical protein AVMA1855_15860 [Acidovorax sp. SUPP1855]
MVNQVDSPDGKPRKDPDHPSPALVETDPAMQRMPQKRPASQKEGEEGAMLLRTPASHQTPFEMASRTALRAPPPLHSSRRGLWKEISHEHPQP